MQGGYQKKYRLTDRMATRQLWLLGILRLQNVANTVEQFDVALLRIGFDC